MRDCSKAFVVRLHASCSLTLPYMLAHKGSPAEVERVVGHLFAMCKYVEGHESPACR